MPDTGTTSGPELLVELDRRARVPLHAQLEDALREAVRSGRLAAGARLPSSRVLAADLNVSRRLVVNAYAQLLAEGYFVARHGAGTFVAEAAAPARAPRSEPPSQALAFDFFPGAPELARFPRTAWLRALRETLRHTPDRSLSYPDPRGASALRSALAGHLRRVRGAAAEPASIVVCAGAAQGLGLIARVLGAQGTPPRIATEDPGLAIHRAVLAAHGAIPVPLAVDEHGAQVDALGAMDVAAAVVTPAHQSPIGVALAPARRSALLEWAAGGRLIVEDDYDAEYRYDRAPLGALQGLAPERVIYLGTTSKTLAPALRLGWLVLPRDLVEAFAEQKFLADNGCPTLDQLALAHLIDSGAYDRHLRQARRRYRLRRDALVAAVARHLPGAQVTGLAAGLHAIVRLARAVDGLALIQAAVERSVGVYPLGYAYHQPRPVHDALVLGYANLSEPAIEEGIRRLAQAVAAVGRGP